MFVWGIRELLSVLGHFDLFWLLTAWADLLVGFLLGFGLITKYALSKNEAAMEKGSDSRQANCVPGAPGSICDCYGCPLHPEVPAQYPISK